MNRGRVLRIARGFPVLLALTLVGGPALAAVTLQPVLTGLSSPVYVTSARDGSGRLFIVEQGGLIKVLQPGATTPTVFLNITDGVVTTGGEQGLLGLAFHPQFATNRRFFVNYTRKSDGVTVIAEYRVSVRNPNVANKGSHRTVMRIRQPYTNHNGGMIEFGPHDGYLYIFVGDGGSSDDPENRAQDLTSRLGKILRIDIDQSSGTRSWAVPLDNPFVGQPGRDPIYAYGFRNPWRASFDRVTFELYVGDVGQGSREEIDIVTKGGNFGWRVFEGDLCTGLDPARCGEAGFTPPITVYDHAGDRCSVIGGYVYRGALGTLPVGSYVFADFCTGEIFLLQGGAVFMLLDTGLNISSFGEDASGELYVVGLGGTVHRIVNAP